ncbi:MAG: hypothetical protein AAF317_03590 [Pseudomonadota bacterium]
MSNQTDTTRITGAVELDEGELGQAHGGRSALKPGKTVPAGSFKFSRPDQDVQTEIESVTRDMKIRKGIRK